ncbi:alpha/beta hydrolase [Egbenema bharatensis]|uniref:alpha/beta hydrolase n=1 Tax=Egbenema bharatensis TaxID=3463334 RepID=UPI003A8BA4FE
MLHTEGTFAGKDGTSLYYQSWHPVAPPKAILGILHGLGGHSNLYRNIVQAIVPQGYAIYGMDLRGHGRSSGQRGYINQWTEFREDFDCFRQLIATQHPVLPCFVMGHSLGSIVVLDYALHDLDGLSGMILMAPPLKPVGVPPLRLAIGRMVSQVYPRFTLNTGISHKAISRNPEVVAAYMNDPLRHTKGTARLVTEYFKTIQWIEANLHYLQTPILLLHGSADAIALPESSNFLFEQIQVADKEFRFYPEAFHDLHNDTDYQQVVNDLLFWLERHIEGDLNWCQWSDSRGISA